jgi:hypothetical protein
MKIPDWLNQNRFTSIVRFACAGTLITVGALSAILSLPLNVTGSSTSAQLISDSQLQAVSTTIGGANPLATTKTVEHWFGTAVNPDNGVTYGFNMVGKNPSLAQTSNIATDIIPINVVVDGMTFSGSDVVGPTLSSPQFSLNDYTSTQFVTNSTDGLHNNSFTTGGLLSSGNKSNQLEDATTRSQFNKQGTSYHVNLSPVTVHDPITIVVPSGKGTLIQTARGVIAADINIQWWATQIQGLNTGLGYVDPTHFPIYLTNNVMLFFGGNPFNCCVFGFHGAGPVPSGNENAYGPGHGSGNQPVQTFAWASYVTPGFFNPITGWALQDIHGLSHEVAEWADDPFINNFVEPWLTPTAPQYGCTNILETGDPVVGIGFTKGTNTFEQGPTPSGTQVADGYYHPEDEVFLPWFMRTSPNNISQPTQSPSTNIGRYTFMGDLNPYPGFRQPATGCQ